MCIVHSIHSIDKSQHPLMLGEFILLTRASIH